MTLVLSARSRALTALLAVATALAVALTLPTTTAVGAVPVSAPAAASVAAAPPPAAGVATAGAPVAAASMAAAAKRAKPSMTIKRSKASWVRGKQGSKITVRVKHAGKAASGKVTFRTAGKNLKTVTLKKGKASYRLPKKLKVGKHTVSARFVPTGASKPVVTKAKKTITVRVVSPGQHIKKTALQYVGVRYRAGGTSPRTGFDCAGFTRYVFKEAGIRNLPRSSSAQRRVGKVVSRSKARAGDIIWTPGHVSIYLGNNKQIDAPSPGKTIKVRSLWQRNPTFIRVT